MYNRTAGQRLPLRRECVDQLKLAAPGSRSKGRTQITVGRSKIAAPPINASQGYNEMFRFAKIFERKRGFLCTDEGTVTVSMTLATFVIILFSVLRSSNLQLQHGISLSNITKPTAARIKNGMSPFHSHAPNIVSLNESSNLRHACIEEIRRNEHSFYIKYMQNANHILLVDPAYHSNVGDHMIAIAELTLLQKRQSLPTAPTISLSQCSYVQAHDFVPSCDFILQTEVNHPSQIVQTYNVSSFTDMLKLDPKLKYNKVALWHGGGNFGDLWSSAQQARIRSIVLLLQANYTIVGMPSSWYYTNLQMEEYDMQQLRANTFAGLGLDSSSVDPVTDLQLAKVAKSRIIWTWREHYSYNRAVQILPYFTHHLVPDIAFQLGPYLPIRPTFQTVQEILSPKQQQAPMNARGTTDIVFLLRNDHESIYASIRNRQSVQLMLDSIPGASKLSFSIVDWDDRLLRFQPENSHDVYFTETAIQLLSMGSILICDRLHAAILAFVSDLSFIYLDQISGKISKTFTLAMESGSNCQRSSNAYNEIMSIQEPKSRNVLDNSKALWTHSETLSDAIEKAIQMLRHQSIESVGKQQRPITREQRRDQIRQKLSAV